MRARPPKLIFVTPVAFLLVAANATIAQEQTSRDQSPTNPQLQIMTEGNIDFGRELVSQRCANCHATKPNEKLFAPTLVNLFGRQAGSIEGFPYTPKIKLLNIIWTPSTLDTWLKTITVNTPDIRMRHVGIERDDEREAVIAYLKTLSK